MASKNADVILNTHSTHHTTSFIKTKGGDDITSIFPHHQISSHNTLDTHSVISMQAVPTNIFQSGGGFVEFSLPRLAKKLEQMTLELKIRNPHSTDYKTILAAVQTLSHIEYFAGTSFLMSTDFLAMRLKSAMLESTDYSVATSKYSNMKMDSLVGMMVTHDDPQPTRNKDVFPEY